MLAILRAPPAVSISLDLCIARLSGAADQPCAVLAISEGPFAAALIGCQPSTGRRGGAHQPSIPSLIAAINGTLPAARCMLCPYARSFPR